MIDGTKSISTSHEPFNVINLDIPRDAYDVKTCLHAYFADQKVNDYIYKNKNTRATIKTQIERLPNVLCIQLKRFIWLSDYGAAVKK